jgi:hypothetical protein
MSDPKIDAQIRNLRERLGGVMSATEVAQVMLDLRELEQQRREAGYPHLEGEERHPTRREQYLMDLMQFRSVQELENFLNGPTHPEFLDQSEVPDEDYELLARERQIEEREYERRLVKTQFRAPAAGPSRRLWNKPIWFLCTACSILVVIGLARMPYDYYMVLRLIFCFTAVFVLCHCSKYDRETSGSGHTGLPSSYTIRFDRSTCIQKPLGVSSTC